VPNVTASEMATFNRRGKKAVRDNFVNSTFGSHHMRLVNYVSVLFNTLQDKQPFQVKSGLHSMNCLLLINSGEAFGLVFSLHTASYGGLLEIKDEPTPETDIFLQELDARAAEMDSSWQPVAELNSYGNQGTNRNTPVVVQGMEVMEVTEVTEPRSGDGTRNGKRKALEILDSIETSPNPLNVSTGSHNVPGLPVDEWRRLQVDQPTATGSESNIVSWFHDGDDLPVSNHLDCAHTR
jgi:hypothetical protein